MLGLSEAVEEAPAHSPYIPEDADKEPAAQFTV